jgi:hypothetical protein
VNLPLLPLSPAAAVAYSVKIAILYSRRACIENDFEDTLQCRLVLVAYLILLPLIVILVVVNIVLSFHSLILIIII